VKKQVAWLAVVIGVAGATFFSLDHHGAPAEAAVPTQWAPAAPPIDAGPPALAEAPPLSAVPVTFQNGFCSAPGVEGFTIRHSLQGLILTELRRRGVSVTEPSDQPSSARLREALGEGAPAIRLNAARDTAARSPDSTLAHVMVALAARAAGQGDEHLAALRRARERAPNDPAIGFALADATRESPELDEPIDALSTYLRVDASPEVSRLRARLEVQRDIQRDYLRLTHDGLTLLRPSDSLSPTQADALVVLIDRALDEAAALTGTARRSRLTVVVYPSRSELLAVSCARDWTGALFDGTLRLVVAPTVEGFDATQVRHETLHAQLSPQAPTAPKWFHEGLAQSFAQQAAPTARWQLMVRTRVWVPFTSLDGSFQVFDAASDADLAYAQSYAMVELMRAMGGDGSIAVALAAFQSGADTPTALARACRRTEVTGEDLLAYLGRRLAQ
jgi:hypothetical protein